MPNFDQLGIEDAGGGFCDAQRTATLRFWVDGHPLEKRNCKWGGSSDLEMRESPESSQSSQSKRNLRGRQPEISSRTLPLLTGEVMPSCVHMLNAVTLATGMLFSVRV